jgi:phospholipid/cholesterol/gamma-HCH transport system ATP-binding protein
MPSSRPHIIVEDLRIGWGTRVLMEHVTFYIERGTTLAILGGSGSGKSTLLRYLIGLEQPMAGRIDIDGVGEPHRYEGVPPFGVLFQSGALFSSMTLADNLALPLPGGLRYAAPRYGISFRRSSISWASGRSPTISPARSRAA